MAAWYAAGHEGVSYTTRTLCRVCEGPLRRVLILGRSPLANALCPATEPDREDATYPLTLMFCDGCSLVQLAETVAPELLFRSYPYLSSYSTTRLREADELARALIERRRLGSDSLVVEAGSNDGYLLARLAAAGVRVLGIDPAVNVAAIAERAGVPTLPEFFGRELADSLCRQGTRAAVVVGANVLAHVADLGDFLDGVAKLLLPKGAAVFEFPYVADLVDGCEFDTIYHEHLCYFSLHSVAEALRRHDLEPVTVERLEIHGGSLRVWAEPAQCAEPDASVAELLAEERRRGMQAFSFYEPLARRARALREDLRALLADLRAARRSVAAYGASAKGTTLLSFCGIGRDDLRFVADRNPHKQGWLTPGTHVPIVPPSTILEENPDYLLLLTWNFADEILREQEAYRRRGGKFIVPVPEVRVA